MYKCDNCNYIFEVEDNGKCPECKSYIFFEVKPQQSDEDLADQVDEMIAEEEAMNSINAKVENDTKEEEGKDGFSLFETLKETSKEDKPKEPKKKEKPPKTDETPPKSDEKKTQANNPAPKKKPVKEDPPATELSEEVIQEKAKGFISNEELKKKVFEKLKEDDNLIADENMAIIELADLQKKYDNLKGSYSALTDKMKQLEAEQELKKEKILELKGRVDELIKQNVQTEMKQAPEDPLAAAIRLIIKTIKEA